MKLDTYKYIDYLQNEGWELDTEDMNDVLLYFKKGAKDISFYPERGIIRCESGNFLLFRYVIGRDLIEDQDRNLISKEKAVATNLMPKEFWEL